jgi:DNA-binding PadR family transcriptional regulator
MGSQLGEFEQLLLYGLVWLGAESYGVAIRQEVERRTGRSISVGAVYTALDRMEARGFVSSRVGEPTAERGGRRRKYFRIEPLGAEALRRSYDALQQMTKGLGPRISDLESGTAESGGR